MTDALKSIGVEVKGTKIWYKRWLAGMLIRCGAKLTTTDYKILELCLQYLNHYDQEINNQRRNI